MNTGIGIDLNNGYNYIGTIYTRTSEKHIPYAVGCVVYGPRKGIYVLDNLGLSILFRRMELTPHYGVDCTVEDMNGNKVVSKCLTAVPEFINARTGEDAAKAYAKKHTYKYIKRSEAYKFVQKIVGG